MKYVVEISPDAGRELSGYLDRAMAEFGLETAGKILDAYDAVLDILEKTPYAATDRLEFIPPRYHFIQLWKYYWLIYQIYEDSCQVKIEYVIDDRMNYGSFVH